MAENKKSFLMYCNWQETFNMLTDEEAGKLIKHFFNYVNDMNPISDERLINLIFEPMKAVLKADLVKYEEKRVKNKENIGKRWNKDVQNNIPPNTTEYDRIPIDTKHTVKDNDKDNDNDNDKGIKEEREPKGSLSSELDDPAIIPPITNYTPALKKEEVINYDKLIDFFNEKTKGVFGTLQKPMGETRIKSVRARIREHGKQTFMEAISMAYESEFLKGDNKTGFTATFDWMIKPTNFNKIISGNYKNKNGNKKNRGISSEQDEREFIDAVISGAGRAEYERNQRLQRQ